MPVGQIKRGAIYAVRFPNRGHEPEPVRVLRVTRDFDGPVIVARELRRKKTWRIRNPEVFVCRWRREEMETMPEHLRKK
jgi:hypothetical protein